MIGTIHGWIDKTRDGDWHSITKTYDGAKHKVYVDGEEVTRLPRKKKKRLGLSQIQLAPTLKKTGWITVTI